ncbi:hypothetical protein FQA39_LY01845 [Lamprigera yunnana]|nr:hypothetical protein FQA39_LY01845 [Lamprigera yunnana]
MKTLLHHVRDPERGSAPIDSCTARLLYKLKLQPQTAFVHLQRSTKQSNMFKYILPIFFAACVNAGILGGAPALGYSAPALGYSAPIAHAAYAAPIAHAAPVVQYSAPIAHAAYAAPVAHAAYAAPIAHATSYQNTVKISHPVAVKTVAAPVVHAAPAYSYAAAAPAYSYAPAAPAYSYAASAPIIKTVAAAPAISYAAAAPAVSFGYGHGLGYGQSLGYGHGLGYGYSAPLVKSWSLIILIAMKECKDGAYHQNVEETEKCGIVWINRIDEVIIISRQVTAMEEGENPEEGLYT